MRAMREVEVLAEGPIVMDADGWWVGDEKLTCGTPLRLRVVKPVWPDHGDEDPDYVVRWEPCRFELASPGRLVPGAAGGQVAVLYGVGGVQLPTVPSQGDIVRVVR